MECTFSLLFDDRTISVLAYNLETILAEKIETVLSRSTANTRPRDFYDIHILYTLRCSECNLATLKQALERSTRYRKAVSFKVFGKDIKRALNMRMIFPLMMSVIPFKKLWSA